MSSEMDVDDEDTQIATVPRVDSAAWRRERENLAESFCRELGKLCDLREHISIAFASQSWILDTVLELSVDRDCWVEFVRRLADRISNSDLIHGVWKADRGRTVFISMGEDAWQSLRCDMFQGSRAISAVNNDPVNSPKRVQTVRVVCGGNTYDLKWRFTPEHEVMAHFLRISLRLNHSDITKVMRSLAGLGAKWESFGCPDFEQSLKKEVNSLSGGKTIMLRAAFNVLRRAVAEGFLYKLPKAFADSLELVELGYDHEISAANRSFQNTWTVLASLESRQAKGFLRKAYPSFFKEWDEGTRCYSHIHILDKLIQDRRHCFLVRFIGDDEPSRATITAAMEQLRESLGAKRHPDDIFTLPFRTQKQRTWFRVDGDEEMDLRLQILSDRLRRAIDAAIVPGAVRSTSPILELAIVGRPAVTIIIWVRQSGEETLKAGSMSRQLTTLLHAVWPWLIPGDHLDVFAETCSTNKHPLGDRNMWTGLLRDKPLYILTTNPDRLTRRAEEADRICAELESLGGGWYVLGDSLGSDFFTGTWYKVEGTTVDVVKKRLRLGRNIAKEAGFHGRTYQATIRLCDYLDRKASAPTKPKQLQDLANILDLVKKAHGYRRILRVSHVSPSGVDKSEVSVDPSITRQGKVLKTLTDAMIRGEGGFYSFRCQTETKDKGTFMDQLIQSIRKMGGRTLIVSISVDRVCSDMATYERLKWVLEDTKSGIISFAWDHETLLNVSEALQLAAPWNTRPEVATWEDSLQSQERAPRLSTNLPMIQPILWIGGDQQQTSCPARKAGERHVQNAQNFVKAFSMTKFQGYDHIDKELLRDNGVYTSSKDREKWKKHVMSITGLPATAIRTRANNGGKQSYLCRCRGKRHDVPVGKYKHDVDCQCRCTFCDKQRACPCARKKVEEIECVCPPMCNCHCKCCHSLPSDLNPLKRKAEEEAVSVELDDKSEGEGESDAGGDSDDGDDQAGKDSRKNKARAASEQTKTRTCINEGCDTELPLKTGRECRACVDERNRSRICWNPTCHNDAPHPGPEACATCQGQGPGSKWYDNNHHLFRRCDIRGCNNLSVVGKPHGYYCSNACKKLAKAQQLREEQAANAADAVEESDAAEEDEDVLAGAVEEGNQAEGGQ